MEKDKILKQGFDLGFRRGYQEAMKKMSKIINDALKISRNKKEV